MQKVADKVEKLRVLVEKTIPKPSGTSTVRDKFKLLSFKHSHLKHWTVRGKRNSTDSGDPDGDGEDEEETTLSGAPASERERSRSFSIDDVELTKEEEQFLAEKFQKLQASPKRRPSLLPTIGSASESIFQAEMAKKKAEKLSAPFRGSFGLYLLRSDKKFGDYVITDECIDFLGQFLNAIWETVSFETIRLVASGHPGSSVSGSAPGSSTSSPSDATPPDYLTSSFFQPPLKGSPLRSDGSPASPTTSTPPLPEKSIELALLEMAVERSLPVGTCHFSKIQSQAAVKNPKFTVMDMKKDFQLIANNNPWTSVQLTDVTGLDHYRLVLSDLAARRMASLMEYILSDTLQLAASILFSKGRTSFLVEDLRAAIQTDASLRELNSIWEAAKLKDQSRPIPVVEKRTSRIMGALVIGDSPYARRGSISLSPGTTRQLSFEPAHPSPPITPNSLLKSSYFDDDLGSEDIKKGISKSRTFDLLHSNPEFDAETASPSASPAKGSGSERSPADRNNVRKSRLIKQTTTSGPFHYIY